jgi:uncharacterized protein (TIGR02588 family)
MKIRKNPIEWTVFAASLLVIAAMLALLTREAVLSKDLPPDVRVTLGTPSPSSGGFSVPVTVANDGDQTAEQARVEVSLWAGEQEVETSELTIAFVPGHSRREGWVVFRRDPSCCALRARTVSFEAP